MRAISKKRADTARRRTRIIKDNKRRGEWAEAVFAARAAEHGLAVSKPMGDSGSFDCVVGRPGKFVAVQVKCTMAQSVNSNGYICSVSHNNQRYRAGAFDFLAAYVIPEDAWYIVPAELTRGLRTVCLSSGDAGKYREYIEAWHLLRRRRTGGAERGSEGGTASVMVARMQGAFHSMRSYFEARL